MPRKIKIREILLLVVSLTLTFLLAEGALKFLDPTFFKGPRDFHPRLGWTAKPGSVTYLMRPGLGIVKFEANSNGFRDIEHPKDLRRQIDRSEAPKHLIKRVVVIGDSFTESAEVDLHETFTAALERRLNRGANYDAQWEIQRFAVGDFGPFQALLALEEFGLTKPKPDLVIFQTFPYNDVINTSLAGAYWGSYQDAYRPYLNPADDFRSTTYLNPITSWVRRHSRVGRFAILTAQSYFGPWGRELIFKHDEERLEWLAEYCRSELGLPADFNPRYLLLNTMSPPNEQYAAIQEGWQAMGVILRRMAELTAKRKIPFIVMSIPAMRQLEPFVEKWQGEVPFSVDPYYAEKRIAEELADTDAMLIPLLEVFNRRYGEVYPYISGHLNPQAHLIVAGRLHQRLIQEGLSD